MTIRASPVTLKAPPALFVPPALIVMSLSVLIIPLVPLPTADIVMSPAAVRVVAPPANVYISPLKVMLPVSALPIRVIPPVPANDPSVAPMSGIVSAALPPDWLISSASRALPVVAPIEPSRSIAPDPDFRTRLSVSFPSARIVLLKSIFPSLASASVPAPSDAAASVSIVIAPSITTAPLNRTTESSLVPSAAAVIFPVKVIGPLMVMSLIPLASVAPIVPGFMTPVDSKVISS